jgi:hypothetical protein
LPPTRYNFIVPTPFFHLRIGEDLIQHPTLPEPIRVILSDQRGAFLFGNTAPDVQVVSGQDRTATHFFDLPIQPSDPQPWKRLLESYPGLGLIERIEPSQAAFLAGYLCHLLADWNWVGEIFAPVFGPHSNWGAFRQRLYLHNVLRSYLDLRLLPELSNHMETWLAAVEPDGWLPFVSDRHLTEWRDILTPQFQPGAAAQTVEVFALRQGIPSESYYGLLNSAERMQVEIFSHLPYQQLDDFKQRLLGESAWLLERYLMPATRPICPVTNPRAAWSIAHAHKDKESQP